MSCENCNQIIVKEVCFTPADPTQAPVTLLLHTKNGSNASGDPSSVSKLTTATDQNTALDPAAYLGGGSYTAGVCPVASPDVEWVDLCEKLASGESSKFIRRSVTSFDALGTATTTVADFELDKVTPYTVNDEAQVGECGCDPLTNTGLVTSTADFE